MLDRSQVAEEGTLQYRKPDAEGAVSATSHSGHVPLSTQIRFACAQAQKQIPA